MRPTKREMKDRGVELLPKFHALDDPNRIRILNIISRNCVLSEKEILRELNISQSTLSHHLKILKRARLLRRSKENHNAIYIINTDTLLLIDSWLAYVHHNYVKSCEKFSGNPSAEYIDEIIEEELGRDPYTGEEALKFDFNRKYK